ncbi:predicted protein [Sclerotinia sclerotiorum 1980 UF-70]|uniref:Secreted protein n=1 Tax=Sclerotinia sclerotiorum (strain ATCC 18683 / 1980 / Ss-1) TaxID=665079 RepID=A7EAM1_SCLS1|nr:predicted protein [Sclerotinia sclerotiorum 1980 UF-70]EDN99499.1 predicted protein [Sclerotinia sclerotiorum 1980 UF-70]
MALAMMLFSFSRTVRLLNELVQSAKSVLISWTSFKRETIGPSTFFSVVRIVKDLVFGELVAGFVVTRRRVMPCDQGIKVSLGSCLKFKAKSSEKFS